MLTLLPIVVALIIAGIAAGRRAGGSRWWPAGFFLGLFLIALVIVGNRSLTLSFVPPFSWAIHPFVAPLLMALAIPLMLCTLIARMPVRRKRLSVTALMVVMLAYYAMAPILLPMVARPWLGAMRTTIDPQRICLQSHLYTCGPASAVTCLRVLDIPAEEGALAMEAYAAPAMGTNPTLLAYAINQRTHAKNIHCEYRLIGKLQDLPTPCIANLFSLQYGGHFVAVLRVTPDRVLIGDPMLGRGEWTHRDFLRQWTGAAHVFVPLKQPQPQIASAPR